jgi:hypothetical protein
MWTKEKCLWPKEEEKTVCVPDAQTDEERRRLEAAEGLLLRNSPPRPAVLPNGRHPLPNRRPAPTPSSSFSSPPSGKFSSNL